MTLMRIFWNRLFCKSERCWFIFLYEAVLFLPNVTIKVVLLLCLGCFPIKYITHFHGIKDPVRLSKAAITSFICLSERNCLHVLVFFKKKAPLLMCFW